jgi:hypothetical protein
MTAATPFATGTFADDLEYNPVHYKLTVLTGAVTLSGKSVDADVSRRMAVTKGTFALTGQAAVVRSTRRLSVTTGVLTLSGKTVTARFAHRMAVGKGIYALSGKDAVLVYAQTDDPLLVAVKGTLALSGKTVTLTYVPRPRTHYLMEVQPGELQMRGRLVRLDRSGREVTPLPGGIMLAGKPIQMPIGYGMRALPGAIELSRLSAYGQRSEVQPGILRFGRRVDLRRW